MLVKFVLLLFCCALINAKSLVQRDPRVHGREEIHHAKLPDTFKDVIRGGAVEWNGGSRVGANMQVEEEEESVEESEEEPENPEEQVDEQQNEQNKEKEEESEESEESEEDIESVDNKEETKSDKKETEDDDSSDSESEEKSEEEKQEPDEKNEEAKEQHAEAKDNDGNFETDDDEDDDVYDIEEQFIDEQTPNSHPAGVLVGAGPKHPETFKFPKLSLDSSFLYPPPQSPENDNLAKTLTGLFDVESLVKNFFPSKDSAPKENLKETETDVKSDDDELIANLAKYEGLTDTENDQATAKKSNSEPNTNLDYKSLGSFVSQAVPKSFDNFQDKLLNFKNFWQKDINRQIQKLVDKEPKVGFGGWDSKRKSQLVFGNATNYVSKAVERVQAQLEEHGRRIPANNPPLTINLIPGTPIIFKLKYVEGAHTLDKHGQSKAIHYNKLYAFTQYKFTELRYYYDVIIRPLNLYGISKSITVILNDARTKMNVAVENDNKMNVLGLEFVNPEVMVDCNTHRFINYGINYLVNDVHPVIKQKLVEIVSRDSKMMLLNYLKDAQ